jgi:hypothetical protein
LELKKKALNEMSEREYEYFRQKDKECGEYRKLLLTRDELPPTTAPLTTPQVQASTPEGEGMGAGAVIAISILGTLGALILIGALASE